MSPRGRIHLAKLADRGEVAWSDADLHQALDTCVGCRACETACPSGVAYGQILEGARHQVEHPKHGCSRRVMLNGMTSRALPMVLNKAFVGRRIPSLLSRLVSGSPGEADLPQIMLDLWPPMSGELPPIKGEVYLLEGCLMKSMFPSVHAASRRLLRRAGYTVRESRGGCCGALHAHNGLIGESQKRSQDLASAMPDNIPIIVNSAGCGSHMKELGFGGRTLDITEFLLAENFVRLLKSSPGIDLSAAYHDACHLAHGQGVTQPPRALLAAVPGLRVIPLRESDLCCGSGGIYNLTQPDMARRLLERKWANIAAAAADVVVMGNPGCHAWISQAAREKGSPIKILHTAELLEASFCGLPFPANGG